MAAWARSDKRAVQAGATRCRSLILNVNGRITAPTTGRASWCSTVGIGRLVGVASAVNPANRLPGALSIGFGSQLGNDGCGGSIHAMTDPQMQPLEIQVLELAKEIATLRHAVCTLVAWIGASAGSPLSQGDCRTLIAMAERRANDQ